MPKSEVPTLTDESVERVEELARSEGPEHVVKVVYAALDLDSISTAREVVGQILPTTDSRGRHSMKYCLECNPLWNGSYGEDGTEAIGRFYVENREGVDQFLTGWMGLCEDCVQTFLARGRDVEPLEGHEDNPLFETDEENDVVHECDSPDWSKHSLVTESGGFDWVQCEHCGIWGKRHGTAKSSIEVIGYERE